jgi:hypothetical protein
MKTNAAVITDVGKDWDRALITVGQVTGHAARYHLEDITQGYRDMQEGRNIRGIIVHDH